MTKKAENRLTTALKPGKKACHGGYSYLTTGRLPEHRKYIEQYLTAARISLIEDLGPTEQHLTAAQIIIIDRVISKLGVIRCMEEYVKEHEVMKGEDLSPSLRQSYLAYNNSVRLDLQALGIDKKVIGSSVTPAEQAELIKEDLRRKKDERRKG